MRQRVKIPTRWSGARLGFSMSGVGSVSAEQAVWNLPATLSVQQGGNIPLRQYALNSDGWQILVSNLPAGVTYNSGLERLEGASTGTSSGTATFTLSRVGGSDVVATATVALVDAGETVVQNFATWNGVTWQFNQSLPVGTFADGSPFVVAPSGVTVTSITPTPTSGRNGSMVNPVPHMLTAGHGFDSRAIFSSSIPYADARNVGLNLPLALSSGDALVSAVSGDSFGFYRNHTTVSSHQTYIERFAILTVVSSAPLGGSFRPGYCGTDHAPRALWNVQNLNYSVLGSYAPPAGHDIAALFAVSEEDTSLPWTHFSNGFESRYLHPNKHMYDYGGEIAGAMQQALLLLNLNVPNSQKEMLFKNIVQLGIDSYLRAKAGGAWWADGGTGHGWKAPMVLAGLALNDANILAYANAANYNIFQEDRQLFTVASGDVGRAVTAPRVSYTSAAVGYPEWGEKHDSAPNRDDMRWAATYRNLNYNVLLGHALAVMMYTGGRSAWGNEVFFDYHDRVRNSQAESFSGKSGASGATSGGTTGISETFVNAMWDLHRASLGNVWTPPT